MLLQLRNPGSLGSAMFSVGDMYKRIKKFKQSAGSSTPHAFYFAKVDVQAAFNTIPQAAIVELMHGVPFHRHYNIVKHCELQAGEDSFTGAAGAGSGAKTTRRWRSSAKAAGDLTDFVQMAVEQFAPNKKNTVFVDSAFQKSCDRRDLLTLMTSHIQENLVKIGKKYYRQKDGIPQGSVLSSMLCNYFYAELERKHLSFLQSKGCLLLRLIDDFLLITTDRAKAARFVTTMHAGLPEYGVQVSPDKSLVNFDLAIGGAAVPTTAKGAGFPFCGTLLDCATLDIAKDRGRARDAVVFNSLTVDFSRRQGQNLRKKVLNAFKIQSHLMYFDNAHNSPQTTLRNIYEAFAETATKTWAHTRCLPKRHQPGPRLITGRFDREDRGEPGVLTERRSRHHQGAHRRGLFSPHQQAPRIEIPGLPLRREQGTRHMVIFFPRVVPGLGRNRAC